MKTAYHIIVADDDDDDQIIIQDAIKKYNPTQVKISAVKDGHELVEKMLKDASVDLIILDINMPKMDGVEALKVLRAFPQFKEKAVFVLSTYRLLERIEASKELGVKEYFKKPSNLSDYQAIVERLFQ
jgi:two-component system response regulator